MIPERWQQVKDVLHRALEMAPAERVAFLEEACKNDADLRSEVESLLRADQAAQTDFLERGPLNSTIRPGTELGPYQIVCLIGAGGMGEVYRAHDPRLGRDVAVKVIPAAFASDSDRLRRFEQEARAAAALNHPNILAIHDFGSAGRVPYVVTELLEGETLRQRLSEGPIPATKAISILSQVAQGLNAAHSKGIVHRDLKPENLFLTSDGHIKILDFGLAKLVRAGSADATVVLHDQTTAGIVMGTAGYMSPEQVRGKAVDQRTDIFALGAIAYEMLSGRRAFRGDTSADTISSILTHEPPALSDTRTVPPGLEQVVRRALQKNAADRFQSAREFMSALEMVSHTTPAPGPAPEAARPTWKAVALALVVVLSAIVVGYFYRSRKQISSGPAASSAPALENAATIPGRPSVAVLGFQDLTGRPQDAWISTALSEMLSTELAQGDQLRVIPGEDVARMKIDLSLPAAESYSKDTLARIRKRLGADTVVVGTYLASPEAASPLRIDLRLQNAESGETLASLAESGSVASLADLLSRAGGALRSKLDLAAITPAERTTINASLPANPEAVRYYAEGLAKVRVFDALAARSLLEKSIALQPDFPQAHAALSEAWSQLGYEGKAADEAAKAYRLSSKLPRQPRLSIEARYHQTRREWSKATEIYQTLFDFFPDNLDYLLHLSESQLSGHQPQEALKTVRQAQAIPTPAQDARVDLMEGKVFQVLSDFRQWQAATTRAVERARAQGARLLTANALASNCVANFRLGQPAPAKAACQESIQIFSAAGDVKGTADAYSNLGNIAADEGNMAEAQRDYQEALKAYRQVGDQQGVSRVLIELAVPAEQLGNVSEAERLLHEAITVKREIGNRYGEANALNDLAAVRFRRGDFAAAETLFLQSGNISRELGDKDGIVYSLVNIAGVRNTRGDLKGSKAVLKDAISTYQEIGDQYGRATALSNLSTIELQQGDLESARQTVNEALDLFHTIHQNAAEADALNNLGFILLAQGNLPDARKVQEQAMAQRKAADDKNGIAESQLYLCEVAIEEGHLDDVESQLRQALTTFDTLKSTDDQISAHLALARLFLARNQANQAGSEREAAAGLIPQTQAVPTVLNFRVVSSRVLTATGQASKARTDATYALQQAAKYGYLGIQLDAELALAELELKSNQPGSRAHLATVEKNARQKGFLLLARKANAAAKA